MNKKKLMTLAIAGAVIYFAMQYMRESSTGNSTGNATAGQGNNTGNPPPSQR